VYSAIVRLVGLGSIVACLIVLVSFGLFAIDQTSSASTRQQKALAAPAATTEAAGAPSQSSPRSKESGVRGTIDETSGWLTSPFDGVTSGSHSEWAIRGVGLLLALAVYGFGVGFLARALRVRV
jgi:hypothetical protein